MKKFFIFSIFLSLSCQKEPLSITEQIREIVENGNIVRVIPALTYSEYFNIAYEPQSSFGFNFSFNGDFVIVDNTSWNLNQLQRYFIDDFDNKQRTIGLIFN